MQKTYSSFIKYKFGYKQKNILKQKLNFLSNWKVLKNEYFLLGVLIKINIDRDILCMQLEQGNEVKIPFQMSQDHYPVSFRFYDPLQRIIKKHISVERTNFFETKIQMINTGHKNNFANTLTDHWTQQT